MGRGAAPFCGGEGEIKMNLFTSYEEENIHYWTHRASGYSGVNQEELATAQKHIWGTALYERIAARFPGRKPGSIRVLDVGTGPGFFAIILAEMGFRVTAVDYTASMLEEARRNAGALADKIDFRQMNAEKLTFADHSFDVLVTRNVTWNLHDPEAAYGHWTRVLAPGGLLLNFDANWYRYLWDAEAEQGHRQDRENLADSDVRDENAGTDVDAMEAIAQKYLRQLQQRSAAAGIQLLLPGELAHMLSTRCMGRDGARQLRRLVQTEVEDGLATFLLRCPKKPGRIHLRLEEGKLRFGA